MCNKKLWKIICKMAIFVTNWHSFHLCLDLWILNFEFYWWLWRRWRWHWSRMHLAGIELCSGWLDIQFKCNILSMIKMRIRILKTVDIMMLTILRMRILFWLFWERQQMLMNYITAQGADSGETFQSSFGLFLSLSSSTCTFPTKSCIGQNPWTTPFSLMCFCLVDKICFYHPQLKSAPAFRGAINIRCTCQMSLFPPGKKSPLSKKCCLQSRSNLF